MSVKIYDVNGREEGGNIHILVVDEQAFKMIFRNALREIRPAKIGRNVWLKRNELDDILNEFSVMKKWAQDLEFNSASGYLVARINYILEELPKQWNKHPEIEQLWMGDGMHWLY